MSRVATACIARGVSAALLAGIALNAGAEHFHAKFSIESLNARFPEFVGSGDGVPIRVTVPSRHSLSRAAVRLNGHDVTRFLSWDASTESLTGTVFGLQKGVNLFEVYQSRRARQPRAHLTVSTPIVPAVQCSGVTALVIPPMQLDKPTDAVHIDSATPTDATSNLPEHCLVRGRINPRVGVNDTPFAIGFELRLPTAWSGRFFFQGGGGNDGVIVPATGNPRNGGPLALTRGFAVVSTDGGHTGTSASSYGFDPQARVDHAYNAYNKTAVTAKAIIDLYYGKNPDKSYFVGCSGGGRQGMMFTQRFPAYFDGVIAGAPAMRVATGASTSSAWQTITYNSIAPVDAAGNRILSQAFSDTDLALVANKALEVCDALDGVADGSINNIKACKFDPALLQCSGGKDASCLSPQQVSALKEAFNGPVNSRGERLYSNWPYDAGIVGADWRNWQLGTSMTATPNSRFVTLIEDAMKNEFFTPPDPAFSIFNYNFDTDPARQVEFGKLYDTWPNAKLNKFRQSGGKLILWNGMSDPIFSANETIEYYERLIEANGEKKAFSFARLFLVPGMNHCGTGPATDTYDTLTKLIDWVENGNAPDRIIASGSAFPGRTRPLCPYPAYARYDRTGNPEAAASFVCREPK